MANIRIKDLPLDGAPKSDDQVPIDLGTTRRTTVEDFVFAGRPTATKTESEAGTDNKKAMTPLAVKQAIDAQTGMRYVPVTRRVDSGTGLSGGQELTGDVTLSLNSASVASLAKADSAVQTVNGKSGNSVTITPSDVGAAPSSIVADVNANTAERHSHTNKAVLDATTASFLASEKTKLSGIETGAQVNTVNSVNTKTGSVVLNASDVGAAPDTVVADINANTAARHTHSNKAILDATTASFLAADKTKLTGIEAGAQVNTVTSVSGKTGAVTLVKSDVGLSNVDNTSDASKPISTATQTALNAKANSSVTVSAGTGLTGGGNLTANRSVALNSASIASLGKADTAIQAPGGTTGQILAKNSNTTNDVSWVTSEAATAVSYAAQTLTDAQKSQARANIDADKVYDTIADVQSSVINSSVIAIRTNGYHSAGGGGGALYKRVVTEPSHAGKVQSGDGAWWEIDGTVLNPYQFGGSGSGANSFATTTASSTSITLSDPADFRNGQKISIEHGGVPTSLTAPTGITVAASGLNRQGPTGSTTYSYRVSTVDENGAVSAASAAVTITDGNDTLGKVTSSIRGLAFNVVRWDHVATSACAVWRSKSGGAYELLGVFGMGQSDSIADGLMDAGLTAITIPWIPATPPSTALAARLVTTITAGGGTTTLTVANAAGSSGAGLYARHDDGQALSDMMSVSRDVEIPAGIFNVGSVTIPSTVGSIHGSGRTSLIQGWGVLAAVMVGSSLQAGFTMSDIRVRPVAWTNQIGVQIDQTSHAVVQRCFFSGNLSIFLSASSSCQILNNVIEDWIDDGVLVYQGEENVIEGNIIRQGCAAIPQNAAAIQTFQSSSNIIKNNKSYGFHVYSIKCANGDQNIVEGNYAANSWCESYHFSGSVSGSRITGNTMFGGTHCMDYAISISNDHVDDAIMYFNEISDNYIYECGTAAIAVVEFGGANADISNTIIKGNTIIAPNKNSQPNMPGILINGSKVTKTYIDGNTFINSYSIDFLVKEDADIYGMPSDTQVGALYGMAGYSTTDGGKVSLGGTGSVKLTGGSTGI